MKYKLYQFVSVALLLIFSAVSAFALENSAIENYRSSVVRSNDGKVQKYSVLVASVGNPKNNSDFSEHFIKRVDEKYYAKGQIYIKTKKKTDKGDGELLQAAGVLKTALQSIGSSRITAFADAKRVAKNPGIVKYGLDRLYKINIPVDKDPFDVCAELMSNPDVEYACPVSVNYKFADKPNDMYVSRQYALDVLKVFEAWEYTKGSENLLIAVVDSGTDYLHSDLADNIYTNPNEIPDDGEDNDGNGKVDDVHGWDFLANTDYQSILSNNFVEDNDPNNKVLTHGTNVAGCIGAVPDNSIGITGTAYHCKILPIKVGSELRGLGLYQTFEAVSYAAEMGAQIINCSWGGYMYSPAEQEIVNYVTLEKNAIIVAAAGNESNNNDEYASYPSSYKHVLSVGATDKNNRMAFFSNHGYNVTTFAPGVGIFTTEASDRYNSLDGTSFSAPLMSGVVALVKSIHPDWEAKKLYHQIRSTSDRKSINGNPYEFFGVANALKAVTYNSYNSDITVPGIGIEECYLNDNTSNTTITTSENVKLNFKLKNYLSSTKDLKVKAFSPDGVLEVSKEELTIAEIKEDGTAVVAFNAKLSKDNPWSEGYAMVALEYSGENGKYSDYEMVKVPLKISSEAKTFVMEERIPVNVAFSSANDHRLSWALGLDVYKRVCAVKFDVANNKMTYHLIEGSFAPTAVAAIDNDIAYFGVANRANQYAAIYKTDNAGHDFFDKNVSSITSRVKAIYFKKDKNNGVFIGDPVDGKWGIGITRNAGYTWEAVKNAPKSANNDSVNTKGTEFVNNTLFFGTRRGKFYKSSDFGKTWEEQTSVTGNIYAMAFIDENVGMIIHLNSAVQVSLTVDGGKTWKLVVNDLIREFGFRPNSIYADRTGRNFVIVNRNGALYKTENYGKSWTAIKKHRNFRLASATVHTDNDGNVSVFQYGGYNERVSYKSMISDRKPMISCKEGAEVDLGSLDVNKTKSQKLTLTNTGDDIGTITGYELKVSKGDKSEFELTNSTEVVLLPGDEQSVRVKFAPKTDGKKEALLVVKYSNKKVEIRIVATANKVNQPGNITVAEGFTLEFGDVEIDTPKEKVLKLNNSSDFDVTVSDVKITSAGSDQGELTFKGDKQFTIKAKTSYDFTFVFKSPKLGKKYGYIEILNDGEVKNIKLQYSANVIQKVSVSEDNVFANAKLMPNPASNSCQLMLGENAEKVQLISIYSADGRLAMQLTPNFNNNILDINTSTLPAGQYSIMLLGNGISETLKLMIVK